METEFCSEQRCHFTLTCDIEVLSFSLLMKFTKSSTFLKGGAVCCTQLFIGAVDKREECRGVGGEVVEADAEKRRISRTHRIGIGTTAGDHLPHQPPFLYHLP